MSTYCRLRFVRAQRMVLNNQWPFEHAGRAFFLGLTEQLVAAAEEMLHHVQPGESQWIPNGAGKEGGREGRIRIVFVGV